MRQKGFTLIELMIVVAIIAILAAVAISQYQEYQNRSTVGGGTVTYAERKPNTLVCTTELDNVEIRTPAIPGAYWEFVGGVFVTSDANGNPVTQSPAGKSCHIEA